MSITLESAARLTALRDKADAVTGESSDTLAGAVDALIAGYGQGSGGGDPYALFDTIMRREITEFNYTAEVTWSDDNTFGCLFNNCIKMEKWAVPNLTWRNGAGYMFQKCDPKVLKYIDLGKPTYIHTAIFYSFRPTGASIIIRSETIPSLTAAFSGTGFTNTYFYVRSALVEEFKTATNWSAYADMFRVLEDYTVDGTATGELDMSKI